ncbi:S1C family serine protease [Brevibacterium sp. GP-SGM9]|uniref:S1C family serine protease n=1 Tax=Brevibacterium sp. GP-SGM9 TaxID=3376990 RepID=UPI0039A70AFE
MSENNDPHNQGDTPAGRDRRGEQESRTSPGQGSRSSSESTRGSSESTRNSAEGARGTSDSRRSGAENRRSTEIPRTFPAGSNGPARVSPPIAPAQRPSVQNQPQQPSGRNFGQNQGGSPERDSTVEQPRVHPTYAPNPVDRAPGQPPQAQTSQSYSQQPQSQGQQPQAQPSPAQPPQSQGPQSQAQQPQGQPTPRRHSAGAGAAAAGAAAATGQPYGGSRPSPDSQAGYSNGQPQSSPGYPNSSGYPGSTGSQNYSAAYAAPGGTSGPGAPGNTSSPGNQGPYVGSQGAYVGSQGAPGYGAQGQGAPGGQPGYGTQDYYNGQGPYGGQAPTRREKRGPGWGATIAIALVAALLGGGAAFGGSYAVSALQGDEPRKVADQTIETPDWTEVAKQTSESVVSIQVGTSGQVQGLGSGSLYDDQGHVITNNHVVAPADTPAGEITVTMKNGETTKAEIVGRDPSTDIAIIKVEQVPDGTKPLPVGDSKKLSVGDPVMALGNPLGLADSVTTGIVSALDRPVSTENIGEDATSQEKEMTITNAIQTDAAINPGNSGGPLVDGNGSFIGVNSAAASLSQAGEGQQSGSIGIGFAIPASQAVMIADQLIANGKAQHPFLGITLTDGQINSGGITRGSAKVQSIQSGSPAEKAGFKDGDDIVAVGDTKVNNAIALRALVRAQPVNSPVEFTVIRGGQEQKLDVSLVLQ